MCSKKCINNKNYINIKTVKKDRAYVSEYFNPGGMNFRSDEKLFIGWFGPRGLASIVFAVIVLNENMPGGNTISMTAVCTILLSVIAHRLSAHPLVAASGARLKKSAGDSIVKEWR